MKSIGAWDTINSIRCQPVKQMQVYLLVALHIQKLKANDTTMFQVWDAASGAYINFNHDGFSKNVAYIVENDVVLYAVLKELEKNSNVSIKNGTKIDGVTLTKDVTSPTSVKLNSGETYSCDLLVSKLKVYFSLS